MTANQIAFANLAETVRHNKVLEGETIRHDVRQEDLGFANLSELSRHNLETEATNWYLGDIQGYGTYHNVVIGYRNADVRRGELGVKQGELGVHEGQLELGQGELEVHQGNLEVAEKNAETQRRQQISNTVGMVWHNALDSVGMLPITKSQWSRIGGFSNGQR